MLQSSSHFIVPERERERESKLRDRDAKYKFEHSHIGTPRRIQVSITVQSVEKISTQDETCEVGMLLDVYWLPSREELEKNVSTFDFEGNFQTVNAIQDNERDVRKKPKLILHKKGHKIWYAQLWISSCFKQQFNLRSFPFDCQRLVVRFEMGKVEKMVYTPVDGRNVFCSVERELCPLTDWYWQGATVLTTGTDRSLSKQRNSYAQMIVIFHLARLWEPYFWRVVVFVFLILLSSLMAYAVDPVDDYGTRISLLLTLVLTQIAFQFTLHGVLPNEPYLSVIEIYVLSSVVLLFLTSIWTTFVKMGTYKFDSDWRDGDDVVALIHIFGLILYHIALSMYAFYIRQRELATFHEGPKAWITKPRTNIQVRTSKHEKSDGFDDDQTVVYSS